MRCPGRGGRTVRAARIHKEHVILPGGSIAVVGSSYGTVTLGAGETNETALPPES